MTTTPPRDRSAIKAIFFRAIELRGEERDAYVAEACGAYSDLRSEVASLLAAHDDERSFLDVLPFEAAAPALIDALQDPDAVAPKLSSGTRIGQYEVLEPLGSGGMAEVYRAHDTKLDRIVALKFVLDTVPGRRERVLREARAASALNHPNICTLFEAGEFEGQPYLAMEYIAGQPLNSLVPPGGFDVATVRHYGVQIAEALAHAHEHGVIHRDLKAANVVVTAQGRAKVLDFGVAKRIAPAAAGVTSTAPTEGGRVPGTLSYMAPELLQDSEADVRTDIWALGVLLYELVAGRRPFLGATSLELTSAIVKDAPPPLPAKVPQDLRAIVVRCLARDPDDRFQDASDVVTALEASHRGGLVASRLLIHRRAVLGVSLAVAFGLIASGWYQRRGPDVRPEVRIASLAVLPFTVLSGSPEIGFLGISVPDTIRSHISVVRSLRVSGMLNPDIPGDDPLAVGRRLGVEYVLTGTIQQSGTEIRIMPRLIRVADDTIAWRNAYTFSSGDLLRLQDDIARGVVEALPVRMTREERASVDRQYTRSAEAYELYMRGRAQLAKNDPATTAAAVDSFRSALGHDRDYVLAHAGVAIASARMGLFHAKEEEVQTWHTHARQAALRALQLGPELAQSHEALAAVFRSTEFEWEQAIEESTRALERNPGLDQPHLFRASAFLHLGLLERVAPEARAAMDSNPAILDEPLRVQGMAALYGAQPEAAVRLLEEAAKESKSPVEWNLAYAYYNAGRPDKAEKLLRELLNSSSARTRSRAQTTLASILAATGRQSQATQLIDAVVPGSYTDHHVAYSLGAAYAQLGRTQEAMTSLEKATTGFRCYPWFDKDPLLAPLRRTEVFQRFLDRLRQSWEMKKAQFAAVQ